LLIALGHKSGKTKAPGGGDSKISLQGGGGARFKTSLPWEAVLVNWGTI